MGFVQGFKRDRENGKEHGSYYLGFRGFRT